MSNPHEKLIAQRAMLTRVEEALRYEMPHPDTVPVAEKVAYFDRIYATIREYLIAAQRGSGAPRGQSADLKAHDFTNGVMPAAAKDALAVLKAWEGAR